MNTDLDQRIARRIARIARGRPGAREDLHEHILAALEAQGDAVTDAQIDSAFAALGSPHEIRESFFPRAPRHVPAWAIIGLVVATTLAALDAFSSKSARCTDADGVMRCLVQTGDGVWRAFATVLPPMIALATHFLGPRWLPTAVAGAWLALWVAPSLVATGIGHNLGLTLAGAITLAISVMMWRTSGDSM